MIRPIDLTSKLLFPKWQLKKGEKDFTVMRIHINGKENGKEVKYKYYLLIDIKTIPFLWHEQQVSLCTAVANLVIDGQYNKVGILLLNT